MVAKWLCRYFSQRKWLNYLTMLSDRVSVVVVPWFHPQSLIDVRPRSWDFSRSRSLMRLLSVRSRPRVYSLPVKTKKNTTSWFSAIYWIPRLVDKNPQAKECIVTLTVSWYIPMATSIESAGKNADSKAIVKTRNSTLSEDRRPVLEFQRNTITRSKMMSPFPDAVTDTYR